MTGTMVVSEADALEGVGARFHHWQQKQKKQGVTNCCQILYTLPEIPFEISEITEISKSEES